MGLELWFVSENPRRFVSIVDGSFYPITYQVVAMKCHTKMLGGSMIDYILRGAGCWFHALVETSQG